MKGRVKCNCDERSWPYTEGWIDQEATGQACQAITVVLYQQTVFSGSICLPNKVGRQSNKNLICKTPGVLLIEILREYLCPNDILSIR